MTRATAAPQLEKDDVFVFFPPGGGGHGDPLDRDPRAVLTDVESGGVTIEGARRHYGVVVAAGRIDAEATAEARAAIRRERLGEEPSFDHWGMLSEAVTLRKLGPGLEVASVAGREAVRCVRCGHPVGGADGDPLAGALHRAVPLRVAGPWIALRHDGDSPNFQLVEALCPGCGTLLDVEERLARDAAILAPSA